MLAGCRSWSWRRGHRALSAFAPVPPLPRAPPAVVVAAAAAASVRQGRHQSRPPPHHRGSRWFSSAPAGAESSSFDVNTSRHAVIASTQASLRVLRESFENGGSAARLAEATRLLQADPELWEKDVRAAKKLARDQRTLTEKRDAIAALEDAFTSTLEMLELAEEEGDKGVVGECHAELVDVANRTRQVELESLLSGPLDHMGCFLEISSGSGGTEAMDFAGQIFSMYEAWCGIRGLPFVVKERADGPDVGIRSSVVAVEAPFAYGWLKGEHGAHRICRVSPYDASQRRHTSFAQVAVFPMEIGDEEESEIEMKETDLRIEAFRSSGPGGQSVNTTSSAVRVTHIPTGLSAASQSERSQHRNKATAMSILKGKLLARHMKQKAEDDSKLRSTLGEATFGSQIRTYYWNPQKFVKDHRSQMEANDCAGVLQGEKLQPFMEAYLRWENTRKAPASS